MALTRRCALRLTTAGIFIGLFLSTWATPRVTSARVTFTVTSTVDAVDIHPGDGRCATASRECTLRAAIQETNALVGANVVFVPPGTYTLTRAGANEDAAATGDLDVTDHLNIVGAGTRDTIIDGGRLDRVFHLPTPSLVSMAHLTVQNGLPPGPEKSGGGIFNGLEDQPGGSLRLIYVTVTNNAATYGGGIMNGWGASASLVGVTISYNSAAGGGGIYTRDSGPVRLVKSTVSNNVAKSHGGGIVTWFHARMSLTNVTVSNNIGPEAGGLVRAAPSDDTGWVVLTASLIANNLPENDCQGDFISTGNNLDSDNTCDLTQPSDLPNLDPRLGPLQDNGGPTWTHALLAGSPAIDHIPAQQCAVFTDQRRLPRPQDGNGDGSAQCDIGAYEQVRA